MSPQSHDSGRRLAGEQMSQKREPAGIDSVCRAVAECAIDLLHASAPDTLIPKVLKRIGTACGIDRIRLCEGMEPAAGGVIATVRHQWDAPGVGPAAPAATAGIVLPSLALSLGQGETAALVIREADEPFKASLTALGAKSMLLAPVFIDAERYGNIVFVDCERERAWSDFEIDALKLLANMIGAALRRARDLQEFADLNWVIANSPVILYRAGGKPPYPLTYVSRNVRRYGHDVRDLLTSPGRYLDLFHPDERPDVLRVIKSLAAGQIDEAVRERRLRAADGRYIWFEDRTRGHYGPGGELLELEGLLVDIGERKAAEAQLAHASLFDPVTGLPNRRSFMIDLDRAFAAARRGGLAFAIHYIDLDRFKDINDVLGHSKGDELLKAVADRLRQIRRKNTDVIARFGGDEFVILQTEINEPADAGILAARLIKEIAEPYNLGTEVHITASIGIAVFSAEVTGPEEMIKQVDLALYRAKDLGRNQFHFHSEALDAATIERVMLGGDLQRALDRGELTLDYQPQVEIATGRIVGLEALARWTHPKFGPIPPSRFVPIAESNGTILRLGRWVIDAVCRQIADWRAAGLTPPPVAFNVSAGQLKGTSEFGRELADKLRLWAIEPKAIEIELTESVLMETTQRHREIIDKLCALGVPIAIDDFGTGYSSLTYLRAYRVDHIKVAQEFIHDIKPGSGDIAIVRAAISLGRELGIPVVAEGVETAFQLDLVREAGCQFVQGYYFSPPVPPLRAAEFLRQGSLTPGAATAPPRPI